MKKKRKIKTMTMWLEKMCLMEQFVWSVNVYTICIAIVVLILFKAFVKRKFFLFHLVIVFFSFSLFNMIIDEQFTVRTACCLEKCFSFDLWFSCVYRGRIDIIAVLREIFSFVFHFNCELDKNGAPYTTTLLNSYSVFHLIQFFFYFVWLFFFYHSVDLI